MQIKLQHWLVKKIMFLGLPLFIAAYPLVCLGQTELKPGKLAIVSVNPVKDPLSFKFVPFVDLEKGTVIHFTDNGFVTDSDSLAKSEHTLTYTAPAGIAAGTVIAYTEGQKDHFTGEGLEANRLTDNILVYQKDAGTEEPVYILGIGWGNDQNLWTYQSESQEESHSDIPSELIEAKHTVISLNGEKSFSYDSSYGTEGTAEALLELISNENYWRSSESISPRLDKPFKVWSEPLIGFRDNIVRVTQPDNIAVSVELVGANDQNVTADIVFLPELSSVSTDPFSGLPALTVTFSGSDTAGTVKAIHISTATLPVQSGKEVVAFGLQNLTNGSVSASKSVLRVEIEPSSTPDVTINEIFAGSDNEADGSGNLNGPDDEFIELVNREDRDIDISKWSFSDNGTDIRHVFPSGTVLPPGRALVLLTDAAAHSEASDGGAIVQHANRYPELSLDAVGDTPTLFNSEGNVVDRYAYGPEAGEGQSITRNPDLTGTFSIHTEAAGSDRLIYSPGTRIDGASFGSNQLIGLQGREGWRALAAPLGTVSFNDLLGKFKVQGISGSDEPSTEPSIYFWNEVEGAMTKPASMSDQMITGRGYLFYYFKDNRRKVSDSTTGIPETIKIDNSDNLSSFSVPVTATDGNENGLIDGNEGFNLLGNPFNKRISVSALLDALEKVDQSVNRNVLVWDHAAGKGNGAYQVLTEGDFIAPSQTFFVRFMDEVSGTVVLNLNELQMPRNFYSGITGDSFGLEIRLADETYQDAFQLEFSEKGALGPGRQDAFKLTSLNPNSVNLYSEEGGSALAHSALPVNLDGVVEIPVAFNGRAGEHQYRFSWDTIGQVPEDWHFTLRDDAMNREVDMRSSSEYEFMHRIDESLKQPRNESLLYKDSTETTQSRFTLVVSPSDVLASGQETLAGSDKLNPNYPNPFNTATTIPFELASETEVNLSIWNIVGQKVATLIDGAVFAAGTHEEPWNASDMPSGIYIAQLEVEGNVYIRKMTLIKN